MKKGLLILFCAIAVPACLGALNASARSVSTILVYRQDGIADITARIEWSVSGGEMHAFSYEGEREIISFDPQRCWVDIPGNRRLPLEISKLGGNEYDIVIADGKGFSGIGYFVLSYRARAAVGLTASEQPDSDKSDQKSGGVYFFFDWGPPDWEYRLNTRTTTLVLPIIVPDGFDPGPVSGSNVSPFITELGLLTEEFVNRQNRIDWYATPGEDGDMYFTLRFHQDNVRARGTQRLEFYLDAESPAVAAGFGIGAEAIDAARANAGKGPVGSGRTSNAGTGTGQTAVDSGAEGQDRAGRRQTDGSDSSHNGSRLWPVAGLAFFGCGIFWLWAYHRKLKGFSAASALLEEIGWAGDAWEAPRIQAGSYQVPGKIPGELHPVEAALLLDLELTSIVSLLLDVLRAEKIIEVCEQNPLRIKILSALPSDDPMAEEFLACFDAEGRLLGGLLADFFEKRITELQEKIWDCDMEATIAYYRKKIVDEKRAYDENRAEEDIPNYYDYRYGAYWWGYHRCVYRHSPYKISLPPEFSGNYVRFMSQSVCFSGCFNSPGGSVNVCYSACHNACHSACHSACVSGKAR